MTQETAPPAPNTVGRRMLAALGIGTAAVAAALFGAIRPAKAMKPPAGKGGAQYRESDHVKKFYKVNRY